MKRFLIGVMIVVAFAVVVVGQGNRAKAADYPLEKPIRLVVPFGAGGGVDIAARLLAATAPELIQQRIDVICMPGAGGQEAVNFVRRQPADGYTFLATDQGPVITTALMENVGFEPSDWTMIFPITETVPTFFTHSDSRIKTVADWVKTLKEKPESLSVAHGRYLSVPHLPLILFESVAGIKNVHVPTSGGSEALAFVLGKKVDLGASVPSTIAAATKAGNIRPLAVASAERVSSLPNTPTLKELGYDVVLPAWYSILAYKGVPQDRLDFIAKKFTEALQSSSGKALAKQASVELTLMDRTKSQAAYEVTIKNVRTILKTIGKIK